MPLVKLVAVGLPIALGVVMIGTGVANFAGPSVALRNFKQWGYPAGFHRVAGVVSVVVGVLLVIPATAWIGVLGSTTYMFAAVVTLIRARDWGHLPGAAVIAAACAAAVALHE